MDNEVLALRRELTKQKRLLQEMQTFIQPLVAELPANHAEERAGAAVTAISMIMIQDQKRSKLCTREAEKVLAREAHGTTCRRERLCRIVARSEGVLELDDSKPRGETTAGVGSRRSGQPPS